MKRFRRGTPSSAEPVTPWQQAEAHWQRWRHDPVAQANWWKLVACALVLINGYALVRMDSLARQAHVVPYIVQVRENGAITGIGPVQASTYQPGDELLKRAARDFVEWVRWFPRDAVILQRNWTRANAMATAAVQQNLRAYAQAAGLSELLAQSVAVDVQIDTVLLLSERSVQVTWNETVFSGENRLVETSAWTGVFQLVVQPPKTPEELERNPLGIYVERFSWAKGKKTT